jgi:MarR family transcriptional regulator for hemolysin
MNTAPDTFFVQDRLAAAMHRCGHAWRMAINEAMAPLKLTHLQCAVLHLVTETSGQRQTELADHMGIEGPSLVRVLDGLEREGWVERRPCPRDRRAKRVFVKEGSADRIAQVFETMRATHEKAVAGLSTEQKVQLVQLIDSMSDCLHTPR